MKEGNVENNANDNGPVNTVAPTSGNQGESQPANGGGAGNMGGMLDPVGACTEKNTFIIFWLLYIISTLLFFICAIINIAWVAVS